MGRLRTVSIAFGLAVLTALAVVGAGVAARGDTVRGGGAELVIPDGWSRIQPAQPAQQTLAADPRTVLVIGTDGVHAIESDCQVSSYRVPAAGAVVVVVGWRESSGVSGLLPLSDMRLRRGTFGCFADRGAVAQVTRRGLDFQVNVMVGDRASSETIADALDAARSITAVPRRTD